MRTLKLRARLHREELITNAMVRGIEKGSKLYTKPYDIMLAVYSELIHDGFQIIPRPHRKDK